MLTTSPFESFATFAAADGLPEYAMRATGLLSNSAGSGGYDRRAIDELFDVAAISRDAGARTPDAVIYAIALDRLKLTPGSDVSWAGLMAPSESTPTPVREPPRTARGARTRAALVRTARTVFERDGYLNARLTDITAEAGLATGSFYTYFTSKEEVFAAVLAEVQEEMLHPHVREMSDSDDPFALIGAANRAYLLAYQRNAKLMRVLEQVATIDDDVRELRRQRGLAFAERNAESIRDLQARGLADPELDPFLAASALSAMVGRIAYSTYVVGEAWELEDLVTTLTRLWANALRIPSEASPAKRKSRATRRRAKTGTTAA